MKGSEVLTDEDIIAMFADHVSSGKADIYRQMELALVPGRREGVRLWSRDGSMSLINCRSSGGVFNLGHRPAAIIEAVTEAMRELDIGDHILLSGSRALLARRLAELMPGDIKYTTFGVSGGEAVDFALKLARGFTGRPGVISVQGGYHGHTGLALASGDAAFRDPFGPQLPGFAQIPFGDIDALHASISHETAAVIIETIPATAGVLIPPDNYLPTVRELCDQKGALFIADEVQAGLGRTGRLWAFDEWGVMPDMVVLGKGLSGAIYPLSATCYKPELDRWLARTNPFIHVSTFGGSDIGCAAAMKVLDIVSEPVFLEHVRLMGQRLMSGLNDLQRSHPTLVKEVRGRGLMVGVELDSAQLGPLLTVLLARHGTLALYASNRPAAMIVMPPLIITAEEIDEVLASFGSSFAIMAERSGMSQQGAASS
jgi:acetylornithine/succinyldiaminopimelate/putrescine aminotransferase